MGPGSLSASHCSLERAVGVVEGTSAHTKEYLFITHDFDFRNLLCDPSPFL